MMIKTIGVLSTIMIIMLMPGGVRAGQRYYVWTEEYGTLAKGNAELEFHSTAVTADRGARSASDWTQRLELEYGVTDHLNASLYQVYEQDADETSMKYLGYNLELKYRIAEANVLPVDILLYAEHEVNSMEGNRFEGKIILSRDIGRLNLSYNEIYERAYSTGKGEHEYAAGVSYEVQPWLRIGVESKGSFTEDEYAAGPTLAWAGSRMWANIGAVFSLNHAANDREVRFMLGVPF